MYIILVFWNQQFKIIIKINKPFLQNKTKQESFKSIKILFHFRKRIILTNQYNF